MNGGADNVARRLAAVVRDSNDAVLLLDLDGTIRAWNRGAEKIYGYDEQEALGQNITMLVPEDRRGETTAFLAQLAHGRPVDSFETTRRTKGGDLRDVWLTVTLLADEHGSPSSVATTERDITERKRLEAERLMLEQRFQEKQRIESLGVLAGGIAHDFNNLLMGVLGGAELALLDGPPPRIRTHLENIKTSAVRLSELTKQLLVYSGKGTFVVKAIDMADLVNEVGRLLNVSFSKKVTLNYELAAELPTIDGDPTQIRQLVMNLVTNAVEAIGDHIGTVTVRAEALAAEQSTLDGFLFGEKLTPGRFVRLEVADSGCGIEDGALKRIFDPFFSTKDAGRGLGLAAVLGIVRSHHGAIRLRSTPGAGTTFEVLFPCGQEACSTETSANESSSGHAAGLILVVDDEEVVRNSVRSFLAHLGYESIAARDGHEGIAALKERVADIVAVVLDLTMPRKDGRETLREMRQLAPSTPIILCSGYNNQHAVRDLSDCAPTAFLQKPFTLEQLARALEDAIARAREGRQDSEQPKAR